MNIAALIAGLLSGIIGAMGLGGGAVLIIYLSVFTNTEQLTAQGINLIFFVPIATLAVIVYSFKKQIRWKTVLFLSFGGVLGAVGGLYLASFLGGGWLSKIFGGFLIILGLREVLKKAKNKP